MFTDRNVRLIVDAAKKAGINPASLLAVVECETKGQPFEIDGKTPSLLYERHVAYRHAKKVGPAMLNAFVKAKLAIPKWSRSTQYKDQGTSAGRLALIAKARDVDEEIANASASWGLGQSMGENGPELGFPSATALVKYMTDGGLPAQVDVLIREVKSKRLIPALNAQDFAQFARKYNGPGYKQNQYDTRMAAAYKRWSRKLPGILNRDEEDEPLHQRMSSDEIKALQRKLASLGYKMVGIPDGIWGRNTVAALNAFQHNEGIPETGEYDDRTKETMKDADPLVPSEARASATEDDLRGASRTIDTAFNLDAVGTAKKAIGAAVVTAGSAEQLGLLGQAQEAVDKVGQVKTMWETVHGWIEPFTSNPTVIIVGATLLVGGFLVSRYAKQIIELRLEDHRSGAHNGSDT